MTPPGEHDLTRRASTANLAVYRVFDPDRTRTLEQHAMCPSIGRDRQGRTVQYWRDEALPRTHALAITDRGVIEADTFHAVAIEIIGSRETQFHRAFDERRSSRMRFRDSGNGQWPPKTMPGTRTVLVILRLQEIRENTLPIPPNRAVIRPGIIIAAVATNINHAVQGTATTKHFSTRPRKRPVVGVLLRRRHHRPVELALQKRGPPLRTVHQGTVVHRACLDHMHRVTLIDHPPSHDAARRPGADHDVVVLHDFLPRHESSPSDDAVQPRGLATSETPTRSSSVYGTHPSDH
jgi:hypothetical protein